MFYKCKCQNCSGSVEFPKEMTRQTIECPHCGLNTILLEPTTGTSGELECNCVHCDGIIKFEGNQFQESFENNGKISGQEIKCPYCKKSTRIYIDINATNPEKLSAEFLRSVRKPVIANVIIFFACLDFIGGIIAGIMAIGQPGYYGKDSTICILICASCILGGSILLGFASVIQNTSASAQRLEHIELQITKSNKRATRVC